MRLPRLPPLTYIHTPDPDTSSIEKGTQELEQNDTVALANQKPFDISLALPGVAGVHDDSGLDPADRLRVKRKLDRPILFLLYTCTSDPRPAITLFYIFTQTIITIVQFMGKSAIATSAILGSLPDNSLTNEHLTTSQTSFMSASWFRSSHTQLYSGAS